MLTNQIHPTPEQLAQLQTYPKNTPLVMVNILKFKNQTSSGESGAAVYARYLKNAQPFVEKSGAKLLWRGQVHTTLIGNENHQAQLIFLVEYPSVDHFFAMVSNPDYQKIATDRTLALEFGGLIACKTVQ